MIPLRVGEHGVARGYVARNHRKGYGQRHAYCEQQGAAGRELFAAYLVGDGGKRAEHEPRKQRHYGEPDEVDELLHGDEADDKTYYAAYGYGQQKADALFELFEYVAEGIQELFVQFEYYCHRRAADAGHYDGEPYENAEHAALDRLLFVCIGEIEFGLFIVVGER